jgi:hypothetical protein
VISHCVSKMILLAITRGATVANLLSCFVFISINILRYLRNHGGNIIAMEALLLHISVPAAEIMKYMGQRLHSGRISCMDE